MPAATGEAPDHRTDPANDRPDGMLPGEAGIPDMQIAPAADTLHDQWQEIQLAFLDDPRSATERARSLVSGAVEAHITTLRDNLNRLTQWQGEETPDTEVLRAAMQGYRSLMASLSSR
jgi:hypothetical protein